jgi:hypothetical protein
VHEGKIAPKRTGATCSRRRFAQCAR